MSFFISSAIVAMIYLGILYYEREQGESSRRIEVVIPAGSTLDDVVDTLSVNGLLRKKGLFKVSAIITGRDKSIKAGRYIFRGNESVAELLGKLSKGEVSYKKLVVPEGLFIKEVASLVSLELGVDSTMFYERAFDKTILSKYKITAPSLEGYLFPDTYLFEWPVNVDSVIDKLGLKQVSDTGAIESMCNEVIAANPDKVEQYKGGKDKLFGFFVGQVMKASKGSANPQAVNEILKAKLS